jgi:hypothetical protein
MARSFASCLAAAVAQNAITQNQANNILNIYNQQFKANAGSPNAAGAARTNTAAILAAAAARKRQIAQAALNKRNELLAYAHTYVDPGTKKSDIMGAWVNKIENFGAGAGTSSYAGAALSKYTMATAKLADLMDQFRKSKLTGTRFNKVGAEDMVEAVYNNVKTPEAKAMADAVITSNEDVRQQFNALGGDIKELKGPWLPQDHNPAAVLTGGKEGKGFQGWFDYIKSKLDLDRMLDPISQTPLSAATPQRLKELLQSAWDHIVAGGWTDRKPATQPQGAGALYNQRQDHRFLHFKTAQDWLAYNRDFGTGDPVSAVFKHLRGMTNDIAAMETFGPNPDATIEWMKQVTQSETAKFVTGKPSLYAETRLSKAQDWINYGPKKLQALYDAVAGGPVASKQLASGVADIRNVLSSAQLGSASVLAAIQDPMIDIAGRHLSGIPAGHAMGAILKTYSRETRDIAVRAGLGLDEFNHILGSEARYAGVLGGHDWSRWLVERTLNLNGLEPTTQARKNLFGIDFMAAVADRANKSFTELGNEMPNFRRTFEDYGLGEKDWDAIKATTPHVPKPGSAPLVRPVDVADRRLGERYLEMMHQQTERAVPTGTARSRAIATLGIQAGTLPGELARSVLQYKAFSLSLMSLQWQGLMMEARGGGVGGVAASGAAMAARGAAYAASLVLPLTLAGAAALQFKNLSNGKDLQDMNPTFWIQALQYGGGLGIMGDYLLADVNRFGQTQTEAMLGPLIGANVDIADKTLRENFAKAIRGEKTTFGRSLVNNVIGRYTPAVSSLFYTRIAYRRMLLDQLQNAVDPDAHKHFRQTEQALHRQTGQGYFWRPGETLPERMPEMAPPAPPHR